MKIPYVEVEKGIFAPVVRLEIFSGVRWLETEAYVDSGASYSIFKPDIAEMLKINYLNLRVKFADHEFNASIGFSDKLGVEFNLLGRESFFKKFMICFNDRNNYLSATWLP